MGTGNRSPELLIPGSSPAQTNGDCGPWRLRLRDAYVLGIRLRFLLARDSGGLVHHLLRVGRHPGLLAEWLTPIDYVRYREFEFSLDAITRHMPRPARILDIGSPKLLPIALAHSDPRCVVCSVDVLESEACFVRRAACVLGLPNLRAQVQDARTLGFPNESFDIATSVSAFEHIAPEQGGEIPAAKELGRMLRPGGIAVLTVPFARSYFAEYRVGTVYERHSTEEEPIFFQRFYDTNRLLKNIVCASGLELLFLRCIEERFFNRDPRKRLAQHINSSRLQNAIFGPWYPVLARIFLSAPLLLEQCRKPYIACLILRRPALDPANAEQIGQITGCASD